jgi:hypothetical protein
VKRNAILALGVAAVLAETALWHGPLGAADRLTTKIETAARAELQRQEMPGISARVACDPLLRRQVILTGPADDFQQAELVRIIDGLPGVSGVRWASPPKPSDGVR